ncbi:MAG TPA: hypothetical protein VNO86_02150 [Candidatus Binatia bacterium]|nr:hypothetical protein [Candidatus Binatia bacterium]
MAPLAPTGSDPLTSHDLCERALRAYERLYRLLDWDDPDLAANVTFVAGRARLLRLAAAAPWPIAGPVRDEVLTVIEAAEGTSNPIAAERLFATFVEEIWRRLERRRPQPVGPFPPLGRRAADRIRRPEADRPARIAVPTGGSAR